MAVSKWSWDYSNGTATDKLTLDAYYALNHNGATSNFALEVWNDMVAKAKELQLEWSLSWSDKYLSYEDTLMTSLDKMMTADRFNSLVFNLPTAYTWIWQEYLGRMNLVGGDYCLGSYFLLATNYINRWIDSLPMPIHIHIEDILMYLAILSGDIILNHNHYSMIHSILSDSLLSITRKLELSVFLYQLIYGKAFLKRGIGIYSNILACIDSYGLISSGYVLDIGVNQITGHIKATVNLDSHMSPGLLGHLTEDVVYNIFLSAPELVNLAGYYIFGDMYYEAVLSSIMSQNMSAKSTNKINSIAKMSSNLKINDLTAELNLFNYITAILGVRTNCFINGGRIINYINSLVDITTKAPWERPGIHSSNTSCINIITAFLQDNTPHAIFKALLKLNLYALVSLFAEDHGRYVLMDAKETYLYIFNKAIISSSYIHPISVYNTSQILSYIHMDASRNKFVHINGYAELYVEGYAELYLQYMG